VENIAFIFKVENHPRFLLVCLSILKMELLSSTKTSVKKRTTRRYITEDDNSSDSGRRGMKCRNGMGGGSGALTPLFHDASPG
jgi:hypothetical protein